MTNVAALTVVNGRRWAVAHVNPGKVSLFSSVAKRLVAAKARYQAIQKLTDVPWFVIAVIHEREASQRFDRSIAQGDPWNRVSTHVPIGRGPFLSFEDAAVDALVNCSPHAARNKDWSAGGAMTLLESYNGLGYASKGVPSPYVWSGTDQYRSGKYVRDHVYDPNTVDAQLGCAGLILAMKALDPTIAFQGEPASQSTPAPATHAEPYTESTGTTAPPNVVPAKAGWLQALLELFKRK